MAKITATDDLDEFIQLPRPPRRLVSLVPSLTEAIELTLPGSLIGATNWCTHPADLQVTRIRGTKNPDISLIRKLQPDLVVGNKEENRLYDVVRLREMGIPVWVTNIDSVTTAINSLSKLFTEALQVPVPNWLNQAGLLWSQPPTLRPVKVMVPIWKKPWRWIGGDCFANDLLTRIGAVNVLADQPDRYPQLDLAEALALKPDLVLLPDEPYCFTYQEWPADADVPTALISGRCLSWYGPAMLESRTHLETAIQQALTI